MTSGTLTLTSWIPLGPPGFPWDPRYDPRDTSGSPTLTPWTLSP